MKVRITGSEDYGRFMKTLISGHPGSGKTLISSTFPHPFYASAEGGLMSIADRGIPYVDIRTSEDLLAIKNTLAQTPEVREDVLGFQVETVVVDTLDEVQKILIAERLKATKSPSMGLQDWGWLGEQMRALIRGYRNLPLNVVFTCHIKEVSDGDTGRSSFKPDLQGAISDSLAQYFDLSLLMQNEVVIDTTDGKLEKLERRSLVTTPSAKYPFLKDRSGKLPPEIDVDFETDFARMYETIFGDVHIAAGKSMEVEAPVPVPLIVEEKTEQPAQLSEPEVKSSPPVRPVKEKPEAKTPKSEGPTEVDGVKVINKLPAGVVPNPKGHGTDLYCESCGDEVETVKRAELSRIRHRKILDDKCYDAMKGK